jgi:hypothetical protein
LNNTTSQKEKRIFVPYILIMITGVVLIILGVIFTYEAYPRFIKLKIPLPVDDYGVSHWTFPTSSIWRNDYERWFLWRAETFLINHEVPDEQSWRYIEEYLDQELIRNGWGRSEYYAPCSLMMPEIKFIYKLPSTFPKNYFLYRRSADNVLTYGDITSDYVCIVVWSDSPGIFNIVILTAKPSPITIFLNTIFSQ